MGGKVKLGFATTISTLLVLLSGWGELYWAALLGGDVDLLCRCPSPPPLDGRVGSISSKIQIRCTQEQFKVYYMVQGCSREMDGWRTMWWEGPREAQGGVLL